VIEKCFLALIKKLPVIFESREFFVKVQCYALQSNYYCLPEALLV
jgi:hypothetical protein